MTFENLRNLGEPPKNIAKFSLGYTAVSKNLAVKLHEKRSKIKECHHKTDL
jgi:hypothetical protein